MAIPRYKPEQINAQTAVRQTRGMAEGAEAQGQAGIAQAQGQLSGQQGQRTNQEIASFSERLNDFSSRLDQAMRADATMKAKEAGVVDQAERRKKIFDIQNKYKNDPKTMDEKIAEVTTATEEDNFSVYGRIYQNQVAASYAAQTEMDAANAAEMALTDSAGSPETFKELYKTYEEEITKGAPNKLGQIATRKAFEKHGTSTYEKLYRAKWGVDDGQTQKNITANITGLQAMIKDSASKGNANDVAARKGQLKAIVVSQYNSGKMGKSAAEWIIRESDTVAETETFMRRSNAATNMGMGYSFLQKIQNPDTQDGKDFQSLGQDAQTKVLNQTKSAINTYEAAEAGQVAQENKLVTGQQSVNFRNMGNQVINEGKRFTSDELRSNVLADRITEAQAKRISDNQDATTDKAMLMRYNSNSTLVTMNEDEIKALPDVSIDDKLKMLDKRETALKSPLYEWTKSVNGKEALKSLAGDYGVAVNPIFSIPGKPDKNRTAYEDKRKELFRRTQALPFEDREKKVLSIYEDITREYEEKAEAVKTQTQETKDANDYNAMKETIDRKNAETFRFSEYTVADYANDTDGVTPVRAKNLVGEFGEPSTTEKVILEKPAPRPTSLYKAPTVESSARALELTGYTPTITGQNVNLADVRTSVKDAAYPILQKYSLGIEDGFRATPGGGAKKSQHLDGNALDVNWAGKSIDEKMAIIKDFKDAGFAGFGIGENTIHVDRRKNPASWSYIGGTATGGGWMPAWATKALRS